jgi:hypothetical protein
MNTFNAEDARRISSDITTEENSTQLNKILKEIQQKAEKEKLEIVLYEKVREAVKEELIKRGFKLKFYIATSQRDSSSTTISW